MATNPAMFNFVAECVAVALPNTEYDRAKSSHVQLSCELVSFGHFGGHAHSSQSAAIDKQSVARTVQIIGYCTDYPMQLVQTLAAARQLRVPAVPANATHFRGGSTLPCKYQRTLSASSHFEPHSSSLGHSATPLQWRIHLMNASQQVCSGGRTILQATHGILVSEMPLTSYARSSTQCPNGTKTSFKRRLGETQERCPDWQATRSSQYAVYACFSVGHY